ncbi:MAG: hypothetical protein ACYCZF_08785 [Anaerolineae bacterium]
MANDASFFALRDALRTLRDTLPQLGSEVLGSDAPAALVVWREKLARVVLPALDFDLPVLLVAICGGGSTGKSTLFNTLAGKVLSRVGFKAGLTTRVLLAGNPSVLSGPGVAQALLFRMRETPVPWHDADQTLVVGPPLYAVSESIPRNLLLLDTPDFDTGSEGRLLNRERAEPILRTAEIILYIFTNTVYNNLSNTRFMADLVGGIGGRPVILVYRISRAASDDEVLEHCRVVAHKLYPGEPDASGFPGQVIGLYRMPESDAVALGEATPRILPLGEMTRGRDLPRLLADLDVARLKRQIFAADLSSIRRDAAAELAGVHRAAEGVALYRQALQQVMAQQALEALKTFPVHEAVSLATRIFLETSPTLIRVLRGTGRVVGAPFKAVQSLGKALVRWAGPREKAGAVLDPEALLSQDMLLSANGLRNRLMDDHLIVRVTRQDPLFAAAERARANMPAPDAPVIEPTGEGTLNLHLLVPAVARQQEATLLVQDWEATTQEFRRVSHLLLGLPTDIEEELRALVIQFRAQMSWQGRLRETLFASLSALPSVVGITYTLLTANPVSGTGIWIQLQSVFGINDLWALVSIPASAGLSDQERKLLEQTITPVFRLWLERRMASVVEVYARTVCLPVLEALSRTPAPDDPRFVLVNKALDTLGEAQ